MTTPFGSVTRRNFGRICAAAWLCGRRGLPAAASDPLTWAAQPDASAGTERRYRADAQIILLSIPLLRRQNVGDGAAIWREAAEDGAPVRLLEFSGRSAPERAAGLNRFGFIQELSRSVNTQVVESLYFGLMTTSPEDNAADARKALHSTSKEALYSAIEGHLTASVMETTGARFVAPAGTSAADQDGLIARARQALSGAPKRTVEWQSAAGAPLPFLHALAGLLNRPGSKETRCAYNGRMYRLHFVDRAPDAKAAAFFREQRLIPATAAVTRVSATLRREEGGVLNEFRLWIEEGSPRPLPLRIEYQAKAYLRLTFEAGA
jgi:hypothetical protein